VKANQLRAVVGAGIDMILAGSVLLRLIVERAPHLGARKASG
jgi:hypothetical protein